MNLLTFSHYIKMVLTVLEGQKLSKETGDHLTVCPCCRRYVDKILARSIFDINVKICKRCAHNEKLMPDDNWVKTWREGQ